MIPLPDIPPGLVVDLGAGQGRFTRLALQHGHAVLAVDTAPPPEQLASVWIEEDVRTFRIPQNVNIVHARNLIQFLTREEGLALLDRAVEALAPGGILAVEAFRAPPEPPFETPHTSYWALKDFKHIELETMEATETIEEGLDMRGVPRRFYVARYIGRKK